MRIERSFVDRMRRNTTLSSVRRFFDSLLRRSLAVVLGIKLRLPAMALLVLAGCGAKNEKCYENGNISFPEIAADRCPDDPNYLTNLINLNPGGERPKMVDRQNFGILSDLMSGVCVLEPPCQVRIPATETRPGPNILPPPPPPPAPEPRDVAEEVREQRDVYEAPADAGADVVAEAVPDVPAMADIPEMVDTTPEAVRDARRDAIRPPRDNGGSRDAGVSPRDGRREVFVP